jgi:lia operon protein LiaI
MMKKFMLFVLGLVALLVLLANLGPMILLGAGIWLLYVVFKKFLKTESTAKKIGLVIVGLIIASITISNIYAVIGIAAGYVLYMVYKHWKSEKDSSMIDETNDEGNEDPFINFEKQWAELNNL